MEELKVFYNQWQKRMFIICYIIWFILLLVFFLISQYISEYLISYTNNSDSIIITSNNLIELEYIISFFTDFIGPLSISYGIYVKAMSYINKKGWKKKFPHLDIDGTWNDISIYTKKWDKTGVNEINDKKVPSPVVIEQTCNSFKIKQSIGDDFEWYSLSADWKDNKLVILYNVEYNSNFQKQDFAEQRTGYESVSIKDFGKNGKPIKMVGKFHQCINDDNKPVYMGDVVYERKYS